MFGPSAGSGYRIGEEIGRGAMGIVYRARDEDLGREVAIKTLLPELAGNPGAVRWFVEEARITGQLQHPGIVPVCCFGELPDGRPFLAMKLIKGRTLTYIRAAQQDVSADLPRFLAVFERVCQTIAYAHLREVIHRDLEPSNVMIGMFGEVQVIDWGLAKVLASGGRQPPEFTSDAPATSDVARGAHAPRSPGGSALGWALGTPAYMSPEQARGENDRHDTRTDVFGLGALLCHILTGRPPYSGASADELTREAAAADLTEAFARPDGCGADPALVALCKRCLAPEPVDRPADGGEVAKGLADDRRAARL